MTDHTLLRGACTQLLYHLNQRLENEWHTGDEYDDLVWKIDRLERFREYVKLDRQFRR
jgi:hypothetical protein